MLRRRAAPACPAIPARTRRERVLRHQLEALDRVAEPGLEPAKQGERRRRARPARPRRPTREPGAATSFRLAAVTTPERALRRRSAAASDRSRDCPCEAPTAPRTATRREAPPRARATSERIGPKRSTWVPPALVETRPPTVAEPLAPSESGKRRPAAAAASCRSERITPASATATLSSAETLRTRFIRRSDSSSAPPSRSGVAPPTIDVFPPCGTSATRASAQRGDDRLHLGGRRRREQRRRPAPVAPAPVAQPRRQRVGVAA